MGQHTSPTRIAIAGSVCSTRATLEALIAHDSHVVGVLELAPAAARNVCGYTRLADLACTAGIECEPFSAINSRETRAILQRWQPDVLFVVGLSQIVGPDVLALPKRGCVGFHPTHLPAGRGRAPLAWLTLDRTSGAATFFQMDDGADTGPIFVQESFDVGPDDYASDVERAQLQALRRALDRWLPQLNAGAWKATPQDDTRASRNARRGPEDGLIDWQQPATEIHKLVRAASHPHPGAYTYVGDVKVIVWRAELAEKVTPPIRGVVGRIVDEDATRGLLVQTGQGLLWLSQVELNSASSTGSARPVLRAGVKLGVAVEDEVISLRQRVRDLEQRLVALESQLKTISGGDRKCA